MAAEVPAEQAHQSLPASQHHDQPAQPLETQPLETQQQPKQAQPHQHMPMHTEQPAQPAEQQQLPQQHLEQLPDQPAQFVEEQQQPPQQHLPQQEPEQHQPEQHSEQHQPEQQQADQPMPLAEQPPHQQQPDQPMPLAEQHHPEQQQPEQSPAPQQQQQPIPQVSPPPPPQQFPQFHQPPAVYESSASALESEINESASSLGEDNDNDSALGSEGEGRSIRTQSVTSSVYEYKWEDGRRYHAYQADQYLMPNDEKEQDRLDLQHHLFRLTAGGPLYIAPIPKDVQSVLDIGCGTGIWTMEFADQHPGAHVLGVDLSPIQPNDVPPNCSFRVDDSEKDWIPDEKFDFVHSRAMLAGFRNWPKVFQQAYDHLTPGGYIELQDFYFPARVHNLQQNAQATEPSSSEQNQSRLVQWCMHLIEAGQRTGLNLEAPRFFPQWLRDAGFVDIHIKWYSWPLGPWAKGSKNKETGRWALANFLDGLSAANKLYTRALGWSIEEVELFVMECRNELLAQKTHVYLPVCFAYARKPREGEHVSYSNQADQT